MRKYKYSKRDADKHFAAINRAWNKISVGDVVQYVGESGYLQNGDVIAKHGGLDRRLVVAGWDGVTHRFADISKLLVHRQKPFGFVPVTIL